VRTHLITPDGRGRIGSVYAELKDAQAAAGPEEMVVSWDGFTGGLDAGFLVVDQAEWRQVGASYPQMKELP
jgi:hypothetical protein